MFARDIGGIAATARGWIDELLGDHAPAPALRCQALLACGFAAA